MARPEDRWFVRWRTAGDADALARVYDAAAPALLRIALHHVRAPAAAEDLVQATFLAAIQNASGYDPARPLLGWLVGILHHQAKWAARGERRVVDASRLREREADDPLAAAQAAEFTAQVDEGIEQLPEIYRPVLRLHLAHELSAAAIAHALGRPPGTVRAQIVRGLELLRAALPAGAALAAFAALVPARTATLREAVLAAGRAHHAAAATTVLVAGGTALGTIMATKKIGFVAAVVLLCATGAWLGNATLTADATAPPASPPSLAQVAIHTAAAASTPAMRDEPAASVSRQPVAVAVPGWRLEGRVTSPRGHAIAGARVRVEVGRRIGELVLGELRTDTDGRYACDLAAARALPPIDRERFKVRVAIDADGHVPFASFPELPHRDPAQALVVLGDAQLELGAIASGRIVDASRRVVADADVMLRDDAGSTSKAPASTSSDADGRFRIASPVSGKVTVLARHHAHGAAEVACEVALGRDMLLPDLVLQARSVLRVRVTFADGEPATGLHISVRVPGGDRAIASATTGPDGRAVVQTLAPGTYACEVGAALGHHDAGTVTTDEPESHVVLHDLHHVRFRFADGDGRALRPIEVGIRTWGVEHDAALAAFLAGVALPEAIEDGAGISMAGDVADALVAGGTWLRVTADHRDAHGDALLQVAPPKNVHDLLVTLHERLRNATLRVRLAATDGGTLGPVECGLHPTQFAAPGTHELGESRDGDDRIFRWYPGRYRLEVRPKWTGADFGWFAPFQVGAELVAGRETLCEQRVVAGGRVRFRLQTTNVDRGNVVGFEVDAGDLAEASPRGHRRRFVRALADGYTMLGSAPAGEWLLWPPLLPPGNHRLVLRSRDHHDEVVAVVITPRTVTDVDVALRAR
jgi:RNA polymerase sigma-70 factor (ECF subfamily)